jgi:sugar phosphate isomerase/epimerase
VPHPHTADVESPRHLGTSADEEAFMTTKNEIPRRELLRMGAAGAAAAWAAARAKLGFAAGKVPIGLQLYSVRKDCEKDLPGTLKAVKGFGYEAVEFAGYYSRTATEMRKLLDDNGLKCCGTHTALETLEGDALAKTIEYNKTIGNKFLICPWIDEKLRKTADDWKKLAAQFEALADKVAPAGMRVGYHNHNVEFTPMGGTTPWDIFFGGTKKVIQQVDLGNCIDGGGDPVALIKRYPGRTVTIHIKEFSKTKPDAFVGEGDVPWKSVFEACETVGGTEWYIVEYEHEKQPALPAVDRCLKNLRKMGK